MSGLTPKMRVWKCLNSVSTREDENMNMTRAVLSWKNFLPGRITFLPDTKDEPHLSPCLQGMAGKSTSGSADLGLHGTISGFHCGLTSFIWRINVEEENPEGCNMSMLKKKPRRFVGNPASVWSTLWKYSQLNIYDSEALAQ
jgi:hypothetical protein